MSIPGWLDYMVVAGEYFEDWWPYIRYANGAMRMAMPFVLYT